MASAQDLKRTYVSLNLIYDSTFMIYDLTFMIYDLTFISPPSGVHSCRMRPRLRCQGSYELYCLMGQPWINHIGHNR